MNEDETTTPMKENIPVRLEFDKDYKYLYIMASDGTNYERYEVKTADSVELINASIKQLNKLKNAGETNTRTQKDKQNQKIVQELLDKYNELGPQLQEKETSSTYRADKAQREEAISQMSLIRETVKKAYPHTHMTDIRA